jgi:thioredoxin 1
LAARVSQPVRERNPNRYSKSGNDAVELRDAITTRCSAGRIQTQDCEPVTFTLAAANDLLCVAACAAHERPETNGADTMISRRHLIALGLVLPLALALPALAAKFTPADLMAAQKTGKPVLVDVTAPWCPTCKAQKAVLSELDKQDRFKGFVKLEVDFDSQKDDVKALKATMQSTLIVFKGDKEMGRLVGDASKTSIEALLAKAL